MLHHVSVPINPSFDTAEDDSRGGWTSVRCLGEYDEFIGIPGIGNIEGLARAAKNGLSWNVVFSPSKAFGA